MNNDLIHEMDMAALKFSPIAAGVVASMAGWRPQDWFYAVGTVYAVLQSAYLVWRWFKELRKRR